MKPGPWRWRRLDFGGGLVLETTARPIRNNDPCIFAIREDWSGEGAIDQATLDLIAAAPRLRSFLIRVLAIMKTHDDFESGYGDHDAIEQLRSDLDEFKDLLKVVSHNA